MVLIRKNAIVIGAVFVCILACLHTGGCLVKKHYNYSVDAVNSGKRMINDVEITSSNGLWFATGYLPEGVMKGIGSPQTVPPDDIYYIKIERKDSKAIKRSIKIVNKIEKSFRGEIIFIIKDNNDVTYKLKRK